MGKDNENTTKGTVPSKMPKKKKPEQDIGGGAVPSRTPQRPKPKKNTNKKD